MENDINTQANELSFTFLEDAIMLKELTNKEDIMQIANKARTNAETSGEYTETIRLAYEEMIKKLEDLTFDEIKEIKQLITS